MSSVRERRLRADHESVRRAFDSHPYIRIEEASGEPPERYRIELDVKGLAVQNGEVVPKQKHLVEVYLTLAYPRQAPQCRMLTPVFHPNIAPHAICIGDHWSAGESLAALIARIGEMITFQSYNTKSPLNGEAAKWAAEHVHELPLSKIDLSVPAPVGAAVVAAPRPAPSPAAVPPSAAPLPPPPLRGAARPVPGADARALVQQAVRKAMDQDLGGALDDLGRALVLDASYTEAYRNRAIVKSKLGDRLGAAADLERVLELEPAHPKADWMRRFIKQARGVPGV